MHRGIRRLAGRRLMGNIQAAQAGRTSTKGDPFDPNVFANRNDRWLTPIAIIRALGTFDLDPCAAPGHETAVERWTPEDVGDGLSLPWHGRVWLNPPYGRESRVWIERLVVHGSGTALIPVATGTKLWQEVVFPAAAAILFYRHRVTFVHPKGDATGMVSPAASALIAIGDEDAYLLERSGLPGYFVPMKSSVQENGGQS